MHKYLIMNTLISKAIIPAASIATGLTIAGLIKSKLPADSAGKTPDFTLGITGKSILVIAGVAAAGGIVLYFANKFLKLNILK